MAITGKLVGGHVGFTSQGVTSLTASIDLVDDVMGQVGHRMVSVNDPAVFAAVGAFVEGQLSALSSLAGCEVSLPTPPPEPTPPEPEA